MSMNLLMHCTYPDVILVEISGYHNISVKRIDNVALVCLSTPSDQVCSFIVRHERKLLMPGNDYTLTVPTYSPTVWDH